MISFVFRYDSHQSSNGWIDSFHRDTADTIALATFFENSDIALITPIASPGVPDKPVVVLKSDDFDTVIKIGSTIVAIDNTTAVELENIAICLDTHRNWLLSNSCGKLVVIRFWHHHIPARFEDCFC
jgi:hypothetical protein